MLKKFLSVQSIFLFIIAACLLLVAETIQINQKKTRTVEPDTLTRILQRGTLRVITNTNAYSFYPYKGQPMGFEYFLAKRFADSLGVDLEIITPGASRMLNFLEKDQGDMIAGSGSLSHTDRKMLRFSKPYSSIRQQLVHHRLIFEVDDVTGLAGKTIHVRQNSPSHERLQELQNQGIDFEIAAHDELTEEDLIREIQSREIKYAVVNSNIGLINKRYYPDIILGLPISQEKSLAWAVRKKDTALLEAIDRFLEIAEIKNLLLKISASYYGKLDYFDYYDIKTFHDRIKTRLPEHRDFIEQESENNGFDWRLIAAMVYQESHFDPWAESHTGVKGLMQVTTETAIEMGIGDRFDPKQSVRAGIQYLSKLYRRFSDLPDPHQRILFALASYNVGYGHVRDAQKIAEAIGMSKNTWSSLKAALPLLTQSRYYKTTEYGYARGYEPVHYVDKILTYYDILKYKSVFSSRNQGPES